MNSRKLIYIIIGIICCIAVILGIVIQISINNKAKQDEQHINTVQTQEQNKETFDAIFDNKFNNTNSDKIEKVKLEESKELVYTASSVSEKTEHYDFDINLPIININTKLASSFNNITQTIFANKANSIMSKTEGLTIYTTEYTSFINNNVLTVLIRAKLKEGDTAQRVIVQSYNYNLTDDTELTIEQAVIKRGISKEEIYTKIQEQVQAAIKETNEINNSGYQVFNRDINSSMYKVENAETFYIGEDGKLYIIYAYGNNKLTSEMDIIVI